MKNKLGYATDLIRMLPNRHRTFTVHGFIFLARNNFKPNRFSIETMKCADFKYTLTLEFLA